MSERDNLLVSIAKTIETYRQGELAAPTPDHVGRWAEQFTSVNQLAFLREFNHVIKQTFLSKIKVMNFLNSLSCNEELSGDNPSAYWSQANFLRIQNQGQSQKEMVSLFGECLKMQYGLILGSCGTSGGDYIYLDDVLFSGNRILTDLSQWIQNDAPQKARVHIILIALHTGGHYYINKKLKSTITQSGKNIEIKFWWFHELENRKQDRNNSDVLWPAITPNNFDVQAYVNSIVNYPHAPRQPGGKFDFFSSEAGRQILEQEFLIAGVKILSQINNRRPHVRPLGYSFFGLGFGTMIVTYRNCPNNCPLAMWWGDPNATSGALHWYPLLSRNTYALQGNVYNDSDDFAF